MHKRTNLEGLDVELLAALQKNWNAEMQQEARKAAALRGEPKPFIRRIVTKRTVAAALVGAALLALWLAQVVGAASAGGGGGGLVHLMM